MKTSQATQKIKAIKSRLATRYFFAISLFLILSFFILFIYLSSQYLSYNYCLWVKDKLAFLYYFQDNKVQLIINIASSLLIILLNVIFIIIIYYLYSIRYQKKYLEVFFEELKLYIEKQTQEKQKNKSKNK